MKLKLSVLMSECGQFPFIRRHQFLDTRVGFRVASRTVWQLDSALDYDKKLRRETEEYTTICFGKSMCFTGTIFLEAKR